MKHLKMRLETESIKKAIEELKDYKSSLAVKNELFIERLLDVGIAVAYRHTGRYTGYIAFEKEVDGGTLCTGVLTGINTAPYISWWYYDGGKKEVEVNALAMAEFGSGWLAEVLFNVPGVGQGTFPEQVHAYDEQWAWRDDKGLHFSRGETPYHPMYLAEMEMLDQINRIAREVFSE